MTIHRRSLLILLMLLIVGAACGAELREKLMGELKQLERVSRTSDGRMQMLPDIDRILKQNEALKDPNVEEHARRLRMRSLESLGRIEEALRDDAPKALEAAKLCSRPDYFRLMTLRIILGLWNQLGKRYEQLPIHAEIIASAKRSGDVLQEVAGLRGIGDYYIAAGRPEEAKKFLLQALELATSAKSPSNVANCHESLGEQAAAMKSFEEAITHYNKAMSFYEKSQDRMNQIDIMVNFGRLELMRQNYADAAAYFERGLLMSVTEVPAMTNRNGQCRIGLATAYRQMRRAEEGKALLDPISKEGKSLQGLETRLRFAREYSLTLEALGEYKLALEWSRKQVAMSEIFVGEQAQDRLNEAEVSFGLAKKNLEIDLLKQKEQEKEANLRAAAADLKAAEARAAKEHTQRNLILVSFVFGALVLASIGVLFFVRMRMRQKAERLHVEAERRMLEARRLESLGVLASGIAHDFNNLLTVIIGNAELIKSDPRFAGEPMPEIASVLLASQQASALCRQMLQYSGREHVNLAALEPRKILAELTDALRVKAPKCRFTITGETEALFVQADRAQASQLFQNLLTNALESIDGKSGMVEINVSKMAIIGEEGARYTPPVKPGEYCCIDIRDDGPGIPAENIGRLFEPFFTTKFLGRGLGLAVVAGILRNHHGGILAESMTGRGATFRVLLPLGTAAKPASSPIEQIEKPGLSRRPLPATQQAVVLLADDEERVRSVVSTQLKNIGCRVLVATSGEDAINLHKLHMNEITVALFDVEMPARGGIEASQAVRLSDPDLPVFLMSGYSKPSELAAELQNIAGFLPKPISQLDLRRVVASSRAT